MSVRDGRNGDGTFASGNPGGPGRPRRPVEREYVAALLDSVTLEDWRQIATKAVQDAKSGDAKARDWLTKYVLGDKPISSEKLAADELAGITAETIIVDAAADAKKNAVRNAAMNKEIDSVLNGICGLET